MDLLLDRLRDADDDDDDDDDDTITADIYRLVLMQKHGRWQF